MKNRESPNKPDVSDKEKKLGKRAKVTPEKVLGGDPTPDLPNSMAQELDAQSDPEKELGPLDDPLITKP